MKAGRLKLEGRRGRLKAECLFVLQPSPSFAFRLQPSPSPFSLQPSPFMVQTSHFPLQTFTRKDHGRPWLGTNAIGRAAAKDARNRSALA